MKRRYRLRRKAEFQSVLAGKRFYSGRALVAFAVPNSSDENHVGVTVSKAVKSSVQRNLARRRLRDLARVKLLGPDSPLASLGIRYDVVLIARPAALDVSFAVLSEEAAQAVLRLSRLNR